MHFSKHNFNHAARTVWIIIYQNLFNDNFLIDFLYVIYRFTNYHGKKCINPLTNETLELILDTSVDPKFGTG